MVQALVTLGEHEDRVLTIVKGKFGLKTKSEAVNFVIEKFGQELLEPELRPEYIEKAKKIMKQKPINVGSLENFRKRYSLK